MPLPTTPKRLTTPGEGASDSRHEVIATDDGFLLAWNRASGFANEVLVQRFSADGKALGKPVSLDGPRFIEGLPELVDLGGDRYGVLWKTSSLAEGFVQLKSAVIDGATGEASAPVVVVEQRAASFIHDLAPLSNGKVALVTRSHLSGEDTTLQLLDARMRPVGQPVTIEDDVSGPFGAASYEQTVVANGKGGVAIFRAADGQIKGVAFGASGAPGKPFQINSTDMPPLDFFGLARFTVKAEELDGGGFVVVWSAPDADVPLNFNVMARIYGENGKPVGRDFVVNQDLAGHQAEPEILAFDKGFAVAWADSAVNGKQTHMLRFFDEKGRPASDDIVSEHFGVDGGGVAFAGADIEYARLDDGSYVKTYAADGALVGERVPEARFGSAKSEKLNGSKADEIILGLAGKDRMDAGAGADTLDGGEGDDILKGGAGDDMLLGGAGKDQLYGGAGADIFVFRPGGGADRVQDFDATDRIDLSAFHYDRAEDVLDAARQVGKNVVISLADQADGATGVATVTLTGVKLAQLAGEDFIL